MNYWVRILAAVGAGFLAMVIVSLLKATIGINAEYFVGFVVASALYELGIMKVGFKKEETK